MRATSERKQLGILVDPLLWKELKIFALQHDMTATDALHHAITEYINRHAARPAHEEDLCLHKNKQFDKEVNSGDPMDSGDRWTPLCKKADKDTRSISKPGKSKSAKRGSK